MMCVECRRGVVEVVIDYDGRRAFVLVKPSFYDTAQRTISELEKEGYEVHVYNAGVPEELEEFEDLWWYMCEATPEDLKPVRVFRTVEELEEALGLK